jgi:hypothetical protein
MTSGSPTIPIDWSVRAITVGGVPLQVARLLVSPCFPLIGSGRISLPELCWLDTGAPISVIPFHVHHQRLSPQSVGVQTTWLGQICDLGRVEVWFSAGPGLPMVGPFSMPTKFPRSDPPGDPVPVLLGLEFFLAHQAHMTIPPPPGKGSIQLP